MNEASYTPERLQRAREAEKHHVEHMPSTEHLLDKPFLSATHLDVDRAVYEIGVFSAMIQSLPCGPGSRILDLGAGSCWVSEWLQRLKYETVSLDISLDMLKIGRQRLAPGSLLCAGDMAALPFQDDIFDGAVCYGALHHVPNWPRALEEIHRVLKPGGVVVFHEPGKGHHDAAESAAQEEQFGVLEQDLPARMLARACRTAGFTRAVVRPVLNPGLCRSRLFAPYAFWRLSPRIFVHKRVLRAKAVLKESLLNLLTPYHLVVATSSNVIADSRRPETILAKFRSVECPSRVSTGDSFTLAATVVNTGNTRWLARTDESRRWQVRLGIALLAADGTMCDMDFGRIDLPHDIEPGETVRLKGHLQAPQTTGSFQLKIDLVAEGVCWFEAHGTVPQQLGIHVADNGGAA